MSPVFSLVMELPLRLHHKVSPSKELLTLVFVLDKVNHYPLGQLGITPSV